MSLTLKKIIVILCFTYEQYVLLGIETINYQIKRSKFNHSSLRKCKIMQNIFRPHDCYQHTVHLRMEVLARNSSKPFGRCKKPTVVNSAAAFCIVA